MPCHDWTGTINIGPNKPIDWDGTASHTIKEAYDWTGSMSTLIYRAVNSLFPGIAWAVRGNDTDEINHSASSLGLICRETSLSGGSACVYTYADVSSWTYLTMNMTCYYASPYGQGLCGIGNFDSFDVQGWPSVIAGWGWDAGIKPGLHNITYYAQTTALTMTANISSLSGTKCIGVCLVARSSVQATTHVSVNSVVLSN